MSEEIPQENPALSGTEKMAADKLTEADLQVIDAAILANCSNHWLKVARVVSERKFLRIVTLPFRISFAPSD